MKILRLFSGLSLFVLSLTVIIFVWGALTLTGMTILGLVKYAAVVALGFALLIVLYRGVRDYTIMRWLALTALVVACFPIIIAPAFQWLLSETMMQHWWKRWSLPIKAELKVDAHNSNDAADAIVYERRAQVERPTFLYDSEGVRFHMLSAGTKLQLLDGEAKLPDDKQLKSLQRKLRTKELAYVAIMAEDDTPSGMEGWIFERHIKDIGPAASLGLDYHGRRVPQIEIVLDQEYKLGPHERTPEFVPWDHGYESVTVASENADPAKRTYRICVSGVCVPVTRYLNGGKGHNGKVIWFDGGDSGSTVRVVVTRKRNPD